MSSDGNKALAEEFEEVVSNDMQNVMQNVMQKAREAYQSVRRVTRSLAKAEEEMPTKQKNSQGLIKPARRMIVLALPAPSQAHLYEKKTYRASKRRKMLEEEAAMQTGEGKEAPNELKE